MYGVMKLDAFIQPCLNVETDHVNGWENSNQKTATARMGAFGSSYRRLSGRFYQPLYCHKSPLFLFVFFFLLANLHKHCEGGLFSSHSTNGAVVLPYSLNCACVRGTLTGVNWLKGGCWNEGAFRLVLHRVALTRLKFHTIAADFSVLS